MERYIQRNWFRNLKNRISAKGGNPESGAELAKEINTDNDVRPSRLVQMIAGLVGLGLAMKGLGQIINDIAKSAELAAFLPLIFGGLVYAYYTMKHKANDAFREIATGVLFLSVMASVPSILRVFEVDLGEPSYPMLLTLAIGGFLMFFNKSSLTAGLLMVVLTGLNFSGIAEGALGAVFGGRVGMSMMPEVDMIIHWILFGAVIKFFMDQNEDNGEVNLKTVLLGWLAAFTLLSLVIGASGGQIFLGLAGAIFALYVFGKKYFSTGAAFYSRPFQTIAIILTGFVLTMCSSAGTIGGLLMTSGVFGEFSTPQIIGLLLTIGLIGATGYYYMQNNWNNGNRLNVFVLTVPALALLTFIMAFAKSEGLMDIMAILYWASGLALFGMYIKNGLSAKYPPAILLGLYFVIQLIIVKYNSIGGIDVMQSGFMNVVFGALLIYLVVLIDKAWGLGNFNNVIPINDDMINKINKNNPFDKLEDMVDGKDNKPSSPASTPPPAAAAPSTPDEPSAPDTPADGGDDAPTDKPEGE